ncbi:asparagine synthase-related protein [Roseivirga sp.]|uniref:asparagine synthase-related protein n=1 Tax=Roseivirga sp. TaxID=1964215 RepID=UPI003B8D0DB3
MKFEKQFSTSGYKVFVNLQVASYAEYNDILYFGFPLYFDLSKITLDNFEEEVLKIKGYFCAIYMSDGKFYIYNDIAAGFRLYYIEDKGAVHINDDYLALTSEFPKCKINLSEYKFWIRHGYTTGDGTFAEGVFKIKPASYLLIGDKVINKPYFPFLENIPDVKNHVQEVKNDLNDTFDLLEKRDHKVILFFSGGLDSMLLFQYLRKHEIPFVLVFLRLTPRYTQNEQDFERAKRAAKAIKTDLQVVEVDLKEELDNITEICSNMPLDRHFSILHFGGLRKLKNMFGNDWVIINGQSSDNVFSFGPSESTFGGMAKRALMYSQNQYLKRVLCALFNFKWKTPLRLPKGDQEFLLAFYNQLKYLILSDDSLDPGLMDYLSKKIECVSKEYSGNSLRTYLKLMGYLQGSDNQVVIQSATTNGFKSVLMPYATPRIILGTVKHKDDKKELIYPKYPISELLEINKNLLKKPSIDPDGNFMPLGEIVDIVDAHFNSMVEGFITSKNVD